MRLSTSAVSFVPNDVRIIADALVARRYRVALSTYWRAYKITSS